MVFLLQSFKSKAEGVREETDSPKHPFGRPFLRTTPSPLLWRVLIHEELQKRAKKEINPDKKKEIYPPPGENITKITCPEYFYVILGGSYGKIT